MSIERLKPAHFFDEERLVALKALAPEAFADGKVNWSTLKDALGGELEEDEEDSEHFGLSWPGKRESRRLAGKPSAGTLVPAAGEGIDEEMSRNIYIEGENLEVLKLLRKSYSNRVKMIYIDPPYNTGNDFVYDDDFTEPLQEYLKRTGQVDGEGKATTTNKKADGRFHSKWLSMMYPRLRLARELLRDDGVIFVSIDDNEVHHLRMLMNEVFGEECFVAEIVWQSKKGGGSDSTGMVQDLEYILCFVKESGSGLSKKEITSEELDKTDEKGPYRIGRELNKWGANSRRQDRPTMYFAISGPDSQDIFPIRNDGTDGRWRWGRRKMETIVANGNVLFEKRGDGTYIVYEKIRTTDPRYKPYRSLLPITATTADGTKRVKELFGKKYFDYAKPVELIWHLMEIAINEDDALVLDFFAGSGTTVDAVLRATEHNDEWSNIRTIAVQLPEAFKPEDEAAKDNFSNISEVAKERIRRVIKKIRDEKAGELGGTGDLDLGFKVFKLAKSHFKPWENYHGESVEKIEELFAEFVTPLVPAWRAIENGLLTEILLLEGFPLDSVIAPLVEYSENTVVEVSSNFHQNRLIVCLDDRLTAGTVKTLKLREADTFVCLDTAVDSQTKTRLADKGQIKTI